MLVASLALWFTLRPHQTGTGTAVIDLRAYSGQRGESASGQAPLQLQGNTRHLVLYLPIGSKEGSYDLALLSESGQEFLHGEGAARLEKQVVVLRAEINVASVPRGSYSLGLRQTTMEWTRFPIKVN